LTGSSGKTQRRYHPDVHDPSLGVYLHVPFCERICPYCDFAVVRTRTLAPSVEARYVDALLTELARRRSEFGDRRLESVYLGGGTPSLLHAESVARLVAGTVDAFAAASDVEVTLEVNPSTVERERLPGFRAAGVNRISLGIQSFDDTILRRLGRAHRAEEGRRTLDAVREAGFTNLSIDLIFAAPGQDASGLGRDLEEVVASAPEHVSCYGLTIEAGTPFERASKRGQLALPEEEEAAAMMEAVEARLEQAGLARYEISSFARPGFASRHNRRYWERRPVLGLGMGAWSSEPSGPDAPHGSRRSNPRELERYLRQVEQGARPEAALREVLDPSTARGEAMFLALRTTAGLRAGAFAAEFGGSPRSFWPAEIDRLVTGGLLLEEENGDLRLSGRGRLVSDSVFVCFV
jgi:oxygen-independent coproporphyrinogen-3 oxidase